MAQLLTSLEIPILAATEVAKAHGILSDRCDILQNGSTLVLRLTDSLVARVVTDVDGPRQGAAWFARETAIAQHLTARQAPVIPLHPGIPQHPHENRGYTMNFWQFVTAISAEPAPAAVGQTLHHCHECLQSFAGELPAMGILTESLALLETESKQRKTLFTTAQLQLLENRLATSLAILETFPRQPVHGDAHLGNLLNTTEGLLWTDWEDVFSGPVEWDLASVIWNPLILEEDISSVGEILQTYQMAGGRLDETALKHSLIARAAVMTTWYPLLYPDLTPARQAKLHRRLAWLEAEALELDLKAYFTAVARRKRLGAVPRETVSR